MVSVDAEPLCDRLVKDVSAIMNSSFWVEALKKGLARGVGDRLNGICGNGLDSRVLWFCECLCFEGELVSAHEFLKEFVANFIEIRRSMFKKGIYVFDEIRMSNDDDDLSNVVNVQVFYNQTDLLESSKKFEERHQSFSRFLIECAYLCILESGSEFADGFSWFSYVLWLTIRLFERFPRLIRIHFNQGQRMVR
jgi:hypothetical protein